MTLVSSSHIYLSRYLLKLASSSEKHKIVGIVYRPNTPPKADMDIFSVTLYEIFDTINRENKNGDYHGRF